MNDRLAAEGRVTAFDSFRVANASAPVDVFREVGGLDGSLPGHSYEDYDLGLRLIEAGIPIIFEPSAVAHHHQIRSLSESCDHRREAGANLVRFARRHPDRVETVVERVALPAHVIRIVEVTRRNPQTLNRISTVVATGDTVLSRLVGRGSGRLRRTAHMYRAVGRDRAARRTRPPRQPDRPLAFLTPAPGISPPRARPRGGARHA